MMPFLKTVAMKAQWHLAFQTLPTGVMLVYIIRIDNGNVNKVEKKCFPVSLSLAKHIVVLD